MAKLRLSQDFFYPVKESNEKSDRKRDKKREKQREPDLSVAEDLSKLFGDEPASTSSAGSSSQHESRKEKKSGKRDRADRATSSGKIKKVYFCLIKRKAILMMCGESSSRVKC